MLETREVCLVVGAVAGCYTHVSVIKVGTTVVS